MRALHNTMMGIGLVVVLTIGVGAIQPWTPAAEAQNGQPAAIPDGQHTEAHHGEAQHGQHSGQHGEMSDAQEHFHMFAEQLGLSEDQQHSIAEPFHEAVAAMETLHHAHDAIVEHLSDEQKKRMAEMIHEMLGASMGAQVHEDGTLHEGH